MGEEGGKVTIFLPAELARRIDQLVDAGVYASRSEFIRFAIRTVLDQELQKYSDKLPVRKYANWKCGSCGCIWRLPDPPPLGYEIFCPKCRSENVAKLS